MIFTTISIFVFAFGLMRHPFVSLLIAFLLIQFTWRTVSVMYINASGEIFSNQLDKYLPAIGGNAFGIAMLVTVVPFYVILRHARAPTDSDESVDLGPLKLITRDLIFYGALVFLAALYGDLIIKGIYPVFSGMERFDYYHDHGGIFHILFFKFLSIGTVVLGGCYVWPNMHGAKEDRRFLLPVILIFVYLFLTSTRYSAYVNFACFFAIPFAAYALPYFSVQAKSGARRATGYVSHGRLLIGGAVCVAILCVVSTFASYLHRTTGKAPLPAVAEVNTTDVVKVLDRITYRMFVLQGEMWGETWHRVSAPGYDGRYEALHFMVVDPGVNGSYGSSGIRYLMEKAIGSEKTYINTNVRHRKFAGGYPETVFEVAGPVLAYPALLVFNILFAGLCLFGVNCFNSHKPYSALLVLYTSITAVALYIDGTFKVGLVWTFYAKFILMVFFYCLESGYGTRLREFLSMGRLAGR